MLELDDLAPLKSYGMISMTESSPVRVFVADEFKIQALLNQGMEVDY